MVGLKEIKEEIKIVQKIKEEGKFYDELDKWACFGYLHGLLYVTGELKSKFNKGE